MTEASANTFEERRRHPRFEQPNIQLLVRRPGLWGRLAFKPVCECLDFSLGGMRFGSNKLFKFGEEIILDLRVYNIRVEGLRAVVTSCTIHHSGIYSCGIRFSFDAQSMQHPQISEALLEIESRLRNAADPT